jgi:type I restriction enzyme S subunit
LFGFIAGEFARLASGSTFLEVSQRVFESVIVPRPHPAEQRRIAGVLDEIDADIDKTKALLAKLKAVRQGLLNDLLTKGLDENGKLRDPKACPEGFVDSLWGNIPRAWDTKTLDELAAAPICYGIVQPGEFVENGVPVLAIKDLQSDYTTGVHRASHKIESRYLRSRVLPADLLLSIKGTIGRTGVVPPWFKGNISRDLARIRPNAAMSPHYLRCLLESQMGQLMLASAVVGTTRAELSINRLRVLRIALPDPEEQEVIVTTMDAFDARIRSEEAYLTKLKLLKKGLMHDLLTGKVRVTVPPEASPSEAVS